MLKPEHLSTLRNHGFVVISNINELSAERHVSALGTIVCTTDVQVRERPNTYLSSAQPIPLHNDHPLVDFIGWHCLEQDDHDGSSVLVDSIAVYKNLTAQTRAVLNTIQLNCPALGSMTPTSSFPFIQEETQHLFYAQWLVPAGLSPAQATAISVFQSAIDNSLNQTRVRLQAGELLIINNRRMLHGRDALTSFSRRHLKRFWIKTSTQ